MRLCEVPGCTGAYRSKGLCLMHYARVRRHGSTESLHRYKCSIDGCERKHKAHGYCWSHWRSWRLTGDPLALVVERRVICSIPGCGCKHAAHGLCSRHEAQARRMQKSTFKQLAFDRFPVEPLVAEIKRTRISHKELARRSAVPRQTVLRIMTRQGRVSAAVADRLCYALCTHPIFLWGDDWIREVA